MFNFRKTSLFLLAVSVLLCGGFVFASESADGGEDNEAFRNVEVVGEQGSYTISGEARVADGAVNFSVEDGHNILVDSFFRMAEPEVWSPFHLHIELPAETLPQNGTLMLMLYQPDHHDGPPVNSYAVPLESFQGHNAFRNVEVEGEQGQYTVTGEARVASGVMDYMVEDGHNILVDSSAEMEKKDDWSPFSLELDIPADQLPVNGTLTLLLNEPDSEEGAYIITLESIAE